MSQGHCVVCQEPTYGKCDNRPVCFACYETGKYAVHLAMEELGVYLAVGTVGAFTEGPAQNEDEEKVLEFHVQDQSIVFTGDEITLVNHDTGEKWLLADSLETAKVIADIILMVRNDKKINPS